MDRGLKGADRVKTSRLKDIVISILALAVVIRHHANIARLMRGTEARFSFTAAQKAREEARRAERGIQS